MLIFNGSITLLIILDDDIRNKHYRKYLCCVQVLYRFISILIFLIKYYSTDFINCARHILGLLRPNLPGTVGTGLLGFFSIEFREHWHILCKEQFREYGKNRCFQVIELNLLAEVWLCYFACVYYRRSVRSNL